MKPVWEDEHHVQWDIFKRTKDDEKLALSVEDLTFPLYNEERLLQR